MIWWLNLQILFLTGYSVASLVETEPPLFLSSIVDNIIVFVHNTPMWQNSTSYDG